ncbi:PEP-CTERM sorting domain-containing protein [Lusitaniella coriacea LEGE 07157]|uniref:PEP-CTERM sorting domain-containing protein n=1 Tax=Lusitaniella coriacea LEGE 07157 TaxID=945747 RepID=A0A8J7DV65_9CYAN|nr:PEP-CTERM sorting domain-containing protein [Lusitaniella coriacea]MBE9115614.1 PEP-CTERM sorting domain-containing protein [Lusitaniella coriacea LEGE 07157]
MHILKQTFLMLVPGIVGTNFLAMPAMAISFNFSFDNALNGGGAVTGVIRGLEEGTGAATSVEVLSNTTGFGLGEYIGSPSSNSWTVMGGELIAFDFISFGIRNTPPATTDSTLFFNSSELMGASFRAGVNSNISSVITGRSGVTTEDIALTFTQFTQLDDEPESVPEPASVLSLFAIGAVATGSVLKRKEAFNQR